MKRPITVAGLLLTLAALACTGAFAGSAATAHPPHGAGFERFLQRYEAANTAFVNGDPSLWLPISAERKPQVLRSTMIFRFDRGAWKIVHRHADTMIALQLPGT